MKNREYYLNKLKERKLMNNDLYCYLELMYFKKNDLLIYQGQHLEYLYILIEGHVKVCRSTANGSSTLCAFAWPISVIGEVEFFSESETANSIFAMEDCICFAIPIQKYRDIFCNDALFIRNLSKIMATRLLLINNNLSISMNYPVENRLASYLLGCHDQMVINENYVLVAEMIGCSYRQLQRVLAMFCQKGYLHKVEKGQYEILNLEELSKLGQDLYQFY